ncbi:amino acid transporter [Lindgomyces ingoldianus]|uniref:Amino acid transporter n=1 Tax=Lindgomyces ingoldianus TaxID=673940 RepID=A0ACB6QQH9_9PLEO|nr:amino acid transporter [Lindgomyces ingoldianus]KAF2469112.1 amino acid transporter [Lindgomyces ingoldianus]
MYRGENYYASTEIKPHPCSLQMDDDAYLARLGKRALLPRSFGFMSILGFSCSSLISWEGILVTSVGGLLNGGPAGVIWGFLVNWLGMLSTFAAIAELASMAPTAGGQYHWVAMMAPKSCNVFLAYLTAWLTVLAWQVFATSTSFLLGTLTQGIVILANPTYVPKTWHTVLLIWCIMLVAVALNSTTSRVLVNFEGIILIVHLVGFFCVLIPLVYFAPHSDPSFVFTTFLNEGGWNSQAISFFVGLPTTAMSLLGADSAVHMSEEIQCAATVVPQALTYTMLINGTLALAMAIAMIFCIGDLEKALAAQETLFYPFIEIFRSAVKSTAGACIMASIILFMGIASGVGAYASASRILWSFSRDRGLPGHKFLFRLSKNSLPVPAICVTLLTTCLFSLIVLGSSVAFNALLSLTVVALFSTYLLVCILLLWRRIDGSLQPGDCSISDADRMVWGPWRLPEPLGTINNVFACGYLIFMLFWSFWPPQTPTTAKNANFSILIFGVVVLFSVVWYMLRARRYFKGPLREVDPAQIPN